jgi:hypothetical protein
MAKIWACIAILGIGIAIGEVFVRPFGQGYMMISACIFGTLALFTSIGWGNTWLCIKKVWK